MAEAVQDRLRPATAVRDQEALQRRRGDVEWRSGPLQPFDLRPRRRGLRERAGGDAHAKQDRDVRDRRALLGIPRDVLNHRDGEQREGQRPRGEHRHERFRAGAGHVVATDTEAEDPAPDEQSREQAPGITTNCEHRPGADRGGVGQVDHDVHPERRGRQLRPPVEGEDPRGEEQQTESGQRVRAQQGEDRDEGVRCQESREGIAEQARDALPAQRGADPEHRGERRAERGDAEVGAVEDDDPGDDEQQPRSTRTSAVQVSSDQPEEQVWTGVAQRKQRVEGQPSEAVDERRLHGEEAGCQERQVEEQGEDCVADNPSQHREDGEQRKAGDRAHRHGEDTKGDSEHAHGQGGGGWPERSVQPRPPREDRPSGDSLRANERSVFC